MGTFLADKLLHTVVSQGASDLHLSVGQPPVLRLDGRMRRLDTKMLDPEDTVALMKSITPERCQQELQEVGGSDFALAFGKQARFRVAIFKQRGNVSISLRLIPYKIMAFEELGLPEVLKELITRPRGLILVTGTTGCGKTTSLATMVDYLNMHYDRHIITIEDPIEYYHTHKKSILTQREIGVDVPDFPEAIRRALRMDPDIILVGEMRDLATISAAITAAETGHIVFATLHTTGAEGTINRVVDVFPKEQQEQIRTQLSVAVIGIISQVLLPRKSKGMVAAFEVLVVTPAISNLIRENKTYRIGSSIQTGRKHGMMLMDDSLFELWRQGLVEEEEILFNAQKPDVMRTRVAEAKRGVFSSETEPNGQDAEDEDDDEFE